MLLYVLVYSSACLNLALYVFFCLYVSGRIYVHTFMQIYIYICICICPFTKVGLKWIGKSFSHLQIFFFHVYFPTSFQYSCHIPLYKYSTSHFTYLLLLGIAFSSFELSQGIGVNIFLAISLCLSMITSSREKKSGNDILHQRMYIVLRFLIHVHKLF